MTLQAIDNITSLLSSFLDVQSRRAEVVAGNLANADTPNYIAKEVDFADFLRNAATEAMTPTTAGAPGGMIGALRIVDQQKINIGLDGNTVDSAREMATLADAGMNYQEGAQLLQMRLRTLRTAIREGK
jgi:flagellar basal-body rod protein FlgB